MSFIRYFITQVNGSNTGAKDVRRETAISELKSCAGVNLNCDEQC
jgi:hypothetical protein